MLNKTTSKNDMKKISLLIAVVLAISMGSVKAADAKANWEGKCAGCHGKEGKGDTKLGLKMGALDYTDPKVQDSVKDDRMFKSIKEGLKKDDKVLMTPMADKLSDDEIKALVAYVRAFKKK
jgi:cytochrome c553